MARSVAWAEPYGMSEQFGPGTFEAPRERYGDDMPEIRDWTWPSP